MVEYCSRNSRQLLQDQDPSTRVSRAGECAREPSLAQDDSFLWKVGEQNQDPSTRVSRAGECAREPSFAQDDSFLWKVGEGDLLRKDSEKHVTRIIWSKS